MKRVCPGAIAIVITALTAFAQSTEKRPAFEAADVHLTPQAADQSLRGGVLRGDRYELHNATLLHLILLAYGLDGGKLIGVQPRLTAPLADKVVGGPAWLDFDRFDVIAKAPRSSSPDDLRAMLRTLLADRFQLTVHNDKKNVPTYVLKAGPHPLLKQSQESAPLGCQSPPQSPEPGAALYRAYSCHNFTMAALANNLPLWASDYFAAPVVDMTGLEGGWDINLKWAWRGQSGATGSDGVSIFEALEKQLGLELKRQDMPVDVVVVDRVTEQPTNNLPDIEKMLPSLATEFEVADVKPTAPGSNQRRFGLLPGGRVDLRGMTLMDLALLAWDITPDMLADAPKWLGVNRFDIVAKAPAGAVSGGAPLTMDELRPMLRTMLSDRFKLTTHYEDRPVTVYAMSLSKRVPNLRKADPASRAECRVTPAAIGTASSSPLTAAWTCQNTSMAMLTVRIQQMARAYIDHKIVDTTGLEGSWDFSVAWTAQGEIQALNRAAGNDPSGGLTVFEAFDRQLGIKLDLQKRTMPVLVIDHVDPMPTDN